MFTRQTGKAEAGLQWKNTKGFLLFSVFIKGLDLRTELWQTGMGWWRGASYTSKNCTKFIVFGPVRLPNFSSPKALNSTSFTNAGSRARNYMWAPLLMCVSHTQSSKCTRPNLKIATVYKWSFKRFVHKQTLTWTLSLLIYSFLGSQKPYEISENISNCLF